MLTHTFIHMHGIGPATEQKLWQAGIQSWTDVDHLPDSLLGPARTRDIKTQTEESIRALENRDALFFEQRLPSGEHYRFFPEFRTDCAYVDIETTGLDTHSRITTIALYDGDRIQWFVQGENLMDFPHAAAAYPVLISYNGRCFDIPFIESYFNLRLGCAQIDLRYVLARLGFKGGLKGCEAALGIDRGGLAGVDGFMAVLLWRLYRKTGQKAALETLLAYNIEDVINLESLMVKAVNLNLEKRPFPGTAPIPGPRLPANPFTPDAAVLTALGL